MKTTNTKHICRCAECRPPVPMTPAQSAVVDALAALDLAQRNADAERPRTPAESRRAIAVRWAPKVAAPLVDEFAKFDNERADAAAVAAGYDIEERPAAVEVSAERKAELEKRAKDARAEVIANFDFAASDVPGLAALAQHRSHVFQADPEGFDLSEFNGTSRKSDLDTFARVTDAAVILDTKSHIRTELARAAAASKFVDRGSLETRADGSEYRRPVIEQPHQIGSTIWRKDGGGFMALDLSDLPTWRHPAPPLADGVIEYGEGRTLGRFFVIEFDRYDVDPNTPAGLSRLLRIRLGRPAPRPNAAGRMPMQWLVMPTAYIGCADADEAERTAWLWSTESELDYHEEAMMPNEFPELAGHTSKSDRLDIEVDPLRHARPVNKPSRADAWLNRPIGPGGDDHLTEAQKFDTATLRRGWFDADRGWAVERQINRRINRG